MQFPRRRSNLFNRRRPRFFPLSHPSLLYPYKIGLRVPSSSSPPLLLRRLLYYPPRVSLSLSRTLSRPAPSMQLPSSDAPLGFGEDRESGRGRGRGEKQKPIVASLSQFTRRFIPPPTAAARYWEACIYGSSRNYIVAGIPIVIAARPDILFRETRNDLSRSLRLK